MATTITRDESTAASKQVLFSTCLLVPDIRTCTNLHRYKLFCRNSQVLAAFDLCLKDLSGLSSSFQGLGPHQGQMQLNCK
eukprot:scaffold7161_cov103-Skeletonema_dohrnii-CCMP3373.AAC.4